MGAGKYIALAVAVVLGSAVAGYFLAGGMHQHDSSDTGSTQVATATDSGSPGTSTITPSAPAKPSMAPGHVSGDYTAPGSPRIEISEEKAPATPDKKPAVNDHTGGHDTEASQEDVTPASTDNADTKSVGTVPAPVTGDSTTPSTSKQSTDPDYEQTGNTKDSEADQQDSATQSSGRAQFRVQVGSFAQANSARSLADALRNRGYSTTTVTEQDGDKTVYHVQAGAFRSRTAADQAQLELQREGFPAFVKPISP